MEVARVASNAIRGCRRQRETGRSSVLNCYRFTTYVFFQLVAVVIETQFERLLTSLLASQQCHPLIFYALQAAG